jgi:hypothetical protein
MKATITILLLICSTNIYSQDFTSVNRKEVEKEVTDENSPNYYPKLLERFSQFDGSLTLQQYRLLYFGFVFQDEYDGYNDNKSKEIRQLLEKKDYKKTIKLCDEVLKDLPVSLTVNYLKAVALQRKDEKDTTAAKYMNRYNHLADAILSSGNGLECKTAYKTIFVDDEYDLIYKYFEVEKFYGQSLEMPCDVLKISPSEKFNHGEIYFDTSETLLAMEKMFKKN